MFSKVLSLCAILCFILSAQADPSEQALVSNDILVLNYALTLEHLEATFYNRYQAIFNSSDFVAAGFSAQVYNYFNMIQGHENTHVSTLQSIIGASAVQACTYKFPVSDVKSYIAVAKLLENTGVMAYDGAIKAISNRAYEQAAATIATVEARHAQYLNLLNFVAPFSAAFDPTQTPDQIKKAISGLIVSCPQPIVLPQFLAANLNNANVTFPNGTTTSSGVRGIASANDLKTLNFALVLEHLEDAFYTLMLNKFSEADFTAAGKPNGTYANIQMIRQHEDTHVSTLTSAISQAGGSPYPVCTYDFSAVKTVDDFFTYAGVFENTGVKAYDGAVNTITDPNLMQTAATIATVEARHAGYLNMENGESPFPNAFDPTSTPNQIAEVVSTYQSCDFTIYLPDVLTITALPPKASSGSRTGANNPSNPTGKTNPTGVDNKSGPSNPTGVDNKSNPAGVDNKTGKTGTSHQTGKSNPSH